MGNTDDARAGYLASRDGLDKVNFWQPNQVRPVALDLGARWFFKRRVRLGGEIISGASFAHFTTLKPLLAWAAFGRSSGARSLDAFVERLRAYALHGLDPRMRSVGRDEDAVGSSSGWTPHDR